RLDQVRALSPRVHELLVAGHHDARLRIDAPGEHYTVGVAVGQWMENQTVHYAKHCRRRTDADAERQNGDHGPTHVSSKCAYCVPKILTKGIDELSARHATLSPVADGEALRARRMEVAHSGERFLVRRDRAESARDVVFRSHLDVKRELVVDVGI